MADRETTDTTDQAARRYADAEVYEALRTVAGRAGHPPTTAEYLEYRDEWMPSVEAVRRRHADDGRPWIAALAAAGLQPDLGRHGGGDTQHNAIKRSLATVAVECGHWPSPDEYRASGALPSVPPIYGRHGSWPEAIEAAQSRYPDVDRLVREGPIPSTEVSYVARKRRKLGIRSVYFEEYRVGAVYLPTHSAGQVAAVLVAAGEYPDDVSHVRRQAASQLPDDIATALIVQLRREQ